MSARPLPYPFDVAAPDVAAERVREGGDAASFDTPEAIAIDRARLDHLAALGLPLEGRRVLDVGGGPTQLAQFFVERGRGLATDAHTENVPRVRELYPELAPRPLDIHTDELGGLGSRRLKANRLADLVRARQ